MLACQIARRGLRSVLIAGALLVGPVALGGMPTLSASAATTIAASKTLAAPTCSTATPAMIKKTLGIIVAVPRRSSAGKAFLCQYASKKSSLAVVIQYNLAASDANYKTVRAGFDANSEPTSPVRTLGTLANEAFSASLGSGSLAQHSVVALQKNLEVVLASSASVPQLLLLMRQILTVS